jgi:glycosyltransferase 2 family protein
MRERRGRLWLGLVIGVVFLYLAFRDADFAKIWELLRYALIPPMLASVCLRLISHWMRALRWRSILMPLKKMSRARAFRIFSLGEIYNALLPARAGDLIRVLLVSKQQDVSKTAAGASILLEKFLDLGVILIFLISTSAVITSPGGIDLPLHWLVLGFATLVLLMMLFIRYVAVVRTYLPFNQVAARFRDGLLILQSPGQTFRTLGVSLLLWVVSGLAVYLVVVALHFPLPWYSGFFIIGVSALGSLVPSAPAAIGTTEFLVVISLYPFGVDRNAALACALLARGLQVVSLALAGIASAFLREE